jgi:hypothetical protein
MAADDAVVGMVEQMLKASQDNLDDSRNDFSHETPAELSSLSLTQTSSKWGVEEGPVSARQQYTESISDMLKQVTQCNTDLIAFLCGVTKTRENFSENELSSTEAVTYLTDQILDSYDAASKVSATETGAAAFSQGITQGIVSFFSGKASVADLAQQTGVTLPSGNTTSAAAALSATPAPVTAPTAQSQAAAFAAAGTQILTGQGGPQAGTNPWSTSQSTPQVPPMLARPTPSSAPTTPAWQTSSTPDDPFGVNLPGPIDQNLYH